MAVGAATEEIGLAIVGAAFFIVCAMFACLMILIRQIADTSIERAALAEEHEAYIAAQAGTDAERQRLRRDALKSAATMHQAIERRREELTQAFEEERFDLASRAFQLGAEAVINDTLGTDMEIGATVYRLEARQRTEPTAMAQD